MNCEELLTLFKRNTTSLSYANPKTGSTAYNGWVSNTHIHKAGSNVNMRLDLSKEWDLFHLFVLAIAWSRSDNWENSAFFVGYLKLCRDFNTMEKITEWVNEELLVEDHEQLAKNYAETERSDLMLDSGIPTNNGSRERVSLRVDILNSVVVLFNNWADIKNSLAVSEAQGDFKIFIRKMRSIAGLGTGNKRMSMKILLILRELRIQGIYRNIDGKLCCVPDKRVKEAAINIEDIELSKSSTINNHIRDSEVIYSKFGDWYDIPLFAYEDII